jgi:HAD superfamily hydrolase (TIGR01509 family)
MGTSTQEWVAYMTRRLELTLLPQEVQDQIVENLLELYREKIPFLPGAVEAVNLAARHFPTALASGSHPSLIDAVTHDPWMLGKFQLIISADEIGVGKPAPDIYLEAARRLGVWPEECICLEDSGNGILSGKRAGMKVIAVPDPRFPPQKEILAQADLVLNSLTDFSLEMIKQLETNQCRVLM